MNLERLKRIKETFALAFRVDRPRAIAIVCCLLINAVAGGVMSIALKLLVDGALQGELKRALIGAAMGAFAQGVWHAAWRVQRNYQDMLSSEVSAAIDRDVLGVTSGIPGIEHFERPDYLDKVSQVVGKGSDIAASTWAITDAISLLMRMAVAVSLLAQVHPVIALLPLFAIPSLLATLQGQRLQEKLEDAIAEPVRLTNSLHALLLEPVPAKEVRVFNAEAEINRRATQLWEMTKRRRLRTSIASAAWATAGWGAFGLAFAVAVAVTSFRVARGQGSIGEVVLVIQLSNEVRGHMANAVGTLHGVLRAFRTMDRLTWLGDYAKTATPVPLGARVPDRLERGIRFEGVSFTYPGTDVEVLHDITLDIAAGSTLALVGDNGAGKTTLVKLLAGYYTPTAGRITVEGTDVRDFEPDEWRARLSGAFQDFARFELVLRESAGIGDLAKIEDVPFVEGAFERGAATDLLTRWTGGLEVPVGKIYRNGVEPSGGQWQKIAVSRAMMRAPLLLLLDEPTSALDATTEDELFRRYAEAAADARTVGGVTVLVSHRFSTVRAADRIVVFDNGSIIEDGTHEELLAKAGRYAQMFLLQRAAFHD